MEHTTNRMAVKDSGKDLMQNYLGYKFIRQAQSREELKEFQFYIYGGKENEFYIWQQK